MSFTREQLETLVSNHGLEVLAFDVLVQGTEYRRPDVEDFIRGVLATQKASPEGEYSVLLERDPDNEFDEFAIKVIGHWETGHNKGRRHIGFVPKKIAYKIAMNVEEDQPLHAFIASINGSAADGFDILFHIVVDE